GQLGEPAGRSKGECRNLVQGRRGRADGRCEDGVRLVMRALLAIAILVVAGCSKHADNQCAGAVGKGLDKMLSLRWQGSAPPPAIVEAMGKLKGVITNRCVEDKWSSEVIDCYAKSAGMADLRACRQKLPPDQQAKLQAEELQVMASAMGKGGG